MYGLMGKMTAHPGQREALLAHLLHAATMLQHADGCHFYVVSRDPADADSLWVTEVWRSEADHQASLTLDAIRDLIAVARPLIAGMSDRTVFAPVGGRGLPATPDA